MERIFFSKLNPNAIIPQKRVEDAGYDIYACINDSHIIMQPHETKLIPTGIASACSPKYYFQLQERGSTGTRGIGQRCGVIDSGYRGEWFIPITNHNTVPLCLINPKSTSLPDLDLFEGIVYDLGKAIAQAVLLPVPEVQIEELSYEDLCLMKSDRMFGKVGSSQK